jgi:CheY-like chemotaxis protein
MPDADGFELMELIQTGLNLSTPVVMMSTDDGDVRLKSLRSGAAQFLPKPVRPDELQSLWQLGLGAPGSGAFTPRGGSLDGGSDGGGRGFGGAGPARSTSLDQLDEAGVAAGMGAGAALLQRRSAELARSAPGSDGYVPPISSSRVERLLREREMRRVRSLTGLSLEQLGLEAEQPPVETADAPSPVPQMRTRDPSVENLAAMAEPEPRQRLLVVANRLPVSAKKRADGAWALEVSSRGGSAFVQRCACARALTLRIAAATSQISAGGLVSALLGIQQNYDICWIGWPGEKRRKVHRGCAAFAE